MFRKFFPKTDRFIDEIGQGEGYAGIEDIAKRGYRGDVPHEVREEHETLRKARSAIRARCKNIVARVTAGE